MNAPATTRFDNDSKPAHSLPVRPAVSLNLKQDRVIAMVFLSHLGTGGGLKRRPQQQTKGNKKRWIDGFRP
jgi:hypothetical protein